MFRKSVITHDEQLLASRPTSKIFGYPLQIIQYICIYPPYCRPFLHPQPEDAPCCGDRDHFSRCHKYSLIVNSINCFNNENVKFKKYTYKVGFRHYKSPVVQHHCLLRCQFGSVESTEQCRTAYCGFQFLCSLQGLILRYSMSVIQLTVSCTCL